MLSKLQVNNVLDRKPFFIGGTSGSRQGYPNGGNSYNNYNRGMSEEEQIRQATEESLRNNPGNQGIIRFNMF